MTDETKEKEESDLSENLSAVGQMIIGEIEAVGGILTGDPLTRAEGEFNVEVGSLHQESNKVLTAIENNEKISQEKLNESDKDESIV
jgi:hypothetical protein